ncbi:MAG: peptide chain release factor N(5)-glutamine methyltransferase [Planctomycetota bacterium]
MSAIECSSLALMRAAKTKLSNSDAPDLDARWLLAHVLGIDHRDAALRWDRTLTTEEAQLFQDCVVRRAGGEPLAHILGEWEFYGHALEVTPAVLVPRPETELLVEWSLELLEGVASPRIVEIGVGSAAVLVALANDRADLTAVGVELSAAALEVAARNLKRHCLEERVELRQGNHFEPLDGLFQLICSNPPYIAEGDPLLEEAVAQHEPELALIDHLDRDGLGHHRALIEEFHHWIVPGGSLLLECGIHQASIIEEYAHQKSLRSCSRADLAGITRVVQVSTGPG